MQKHGSNLVKVYFKSNAWCVPWIFTYTYFGNKTRWKECHVRKMGHRGKAGGCTAFNKVLCDAPGHIRVINNRINRKIRHSKTQEALEPRPLTLNSLCSKQTVLSPCSFVSHPLLRAAHTNRSLAQCLTEAQPSGEINDTRGRHPLLLGLQSAHPGKTIRKPFGL